MSPLRRTSRVSRARRAGFTLIEVMVAAALVGMSLVVMFGFHTQAVRSNRQARKVTDCTYLAQQQLESLVAVPWTKNAGRAGTDLADGNASTSTAWAPLYHPAGGGLPNPVNSVWETTGTTTDYMPAATYYLTWEVDAMDPSADSWIRLRVRCAWEDPVFGTWQGTTISTYRYRDN